jgi:hypothetical protein
LKRKAGWFHWRQIWIPSIWSDRNRVSCKKTWSIEMIK